MNFKYTDVGVLDKVMLVLHAFSEGDTILTPQQLSQQFNLSLPTIYRLTQAMSEHGLLDRVQNGFKLGLALMTFGMRVAEKIDLRRLLLPYLKRINDITEESVHLFVRREEIRVLIEIIHSPYNVRPFAVVGEVLPLHSGAGKTFLAFLPEKEALHWANKSAVRAGDKKTINEDDFLLEMRKIRSNRYSTSTRERETEVYSVAAPVFGANKEIAAVISIVTPSSRMGDQQKKKFISLILEVSAEVSTNIGY